VSVTDQPQSSAVDTRRRILRPRPPSSVRRARTALYTFATYLIVVAIFAAFSLLTGSQAAEFVSWLTVIEGIAIAAAMIVAGRGFRDRHVWARWLGIVIAAVAVGRFVLGFYLVVTEGTYRDPNVGFMAIIGSVIGVMLGSVILWSLLRSGAWFRPLPSDTAVVTAAELRGGDWASVAPIESGASSGTREAPDKAETLISVRDLKKHFPIYGGFLRQQIGSVYAVDGVDFDIKRGEIFSLVGESGCGKTTLGRTILQLTPPTDGRVVFDGYELTDVDPEDMIPLRRRMQIIFQDPFGSLNPRMPVSDIIGEGLLAQGITDRKDRDKRVGDALEVVGLRREYTRRYPHEFSGGQRQRIGVARALALRPDFIVCDEPVSALDVSIQSQVLNLLLDLRKDFDLTYLFISHNLSVVEYISNRIGVMYLGKVVELATSEELYRNPRHPYSVALLSAIPQPDPRRRRRRLVLKGDVPSPAAPPPGCRFSTRCWLREVLGNPDVCTTEEPELRDLGGGHQSACHFSEEVSTDTVKRFAEGQSVVDTAIAEPVA
jgi:oligopeptide/dipeptide ABC transporter ATP-binding protein